MSQVLCLLLSLTSAIAVADDQLAAQARMVVSTHCYECHHGIGSAGGDSDFLDREQLIQENLIDLAQPAESYILRRIREGSMPPLPQRLRRPVTEIEVETLERWIAAGAIDWSLKPTSREPITVAMVMRAVREFLQARNPPDRLHFRFFTLHYQYNDPRATESDLRLYRTALSKTINSLSWGSDIRPLTEVEMLLSDGRGRRSSDPRILFAIDLRHLITIDNRSWSETDLWERVSKVYSYGVSYVNRTGTEEATLQADIRRLVDPQQRVVLPLIRGDWFVANACRPPLYHDLLGLPSSEARLLEILNVDTALSPSESRSGGMVRGGFTKSGVSGQNRLLERLNSKFGAYWRSYDFVANNKRSNLRRFPLGPPELFQQETHPFPDQAFVHDGGEIIFQLPNGLHGYMLVNGRGQRIDEGPIDIVSDPLETSGTPAIVNGVSCMACHHQGIIDFQDEIRFSEAVFGGAAELVRRLYAEQQVLDRMAQEDRTKYLRSLEAATGPDDRVGPEAGQRITDIGDPVGEVARRHRSIYLDVAAVARELDFDSVEALVSQLGQQSVRELGLQPLIVNGGVISRAEWEASDGRSLMQDVAARLGLTPIQ